MLTIFCDTLTFPYIILPFLISAQALQPSPQASTDLICHTSHASDCYPRIFQPTTNFQIVHDDQDLPPGLHIRMNLATGVKEAKLNEPVLDQKGEEGGLVALDDIPFKLPEFQIQPDPQHVSFDISEGDLFQSSISTLKSSSPPNLEAFASLQDLVHSSHWGLTLAKDTSLCRLLLQFLSPRSSPNIRSVTALLLGTAIHNNPPALTAVLSHFYNDEWPTGPLEVVILALDHETLPTLLNRLIFLASGLCRNEEQLQKFVNDGGLEILTNLFDVNNAGIGDRDKLRGKIADFMVDHFLQPDRIRSEPSIRKENDVQKDTGLASHLDDDDSWGMPDHVSHEESPLASESMLQKLRLWCSLFAKASAELTTRIDGDPQAARTLEHLQEAHSALEKKLKTHGFDCR